MKRILLNGGLFVSILFFPWWITIFIGFIVVFLQKRFYEIIGLGMLCDLLYGTRSASLFGFNFFFTVGALALLYGAEYVKEKTRLYS